MIKMYLKIQDIFTRPNEFLPDMSGGQTEFREDWYHDNVPKGIQVMEQT